MKKLILITGMPGSGKTTVARIIGEQGFPVVSMGDSVREEAEARGAGKTILEMSRFMVELRRELGEDAVAKLVERKIEKLKDRVVAVDGIRSLKEVEYFKSLGLYRVMLIGVLAPLSIRHGRLSNRKRVDDPKILEELNERDRVELSVGLGEALALSDVYIVNEGGFNELRRNVRRRISKILSSRYRWT